MVAFSDITALVALIVYHPMAFGQCNILLDGRRDFFIASRTEGRVIHETGDGMVIGGCFVYAAELQIGEVALSVYLIFGMRTAVFKAAVVADAVMISVRHGLFNRLLGNYFGEVGAAHVAVLITIFITGHLVSILIDIFVGLIGVTGVIGHILCGMAAGDGGVAVVTYAAIEVMLAGELKSGINSLFRDQYAAEIAACDFDKVVGAGVGVSVIVYDAVGDVPAVPYVLILSGMLAGICVAAFIAFAGDRVVVMIFALGGYAGFFVIELGAAVIAVVIDDLLAGDGMVAVIDHCIVSVADIAYFSDIEMLAGVFVTASVTDSLCIIVMGFGFAFDTAAGLGNIHAAGVAVFFRDKCAGGQM